MKSFKIFAMTVILATSFLARAQAASISRAQVENFVNLANEALAWNSVQKFHITLTTAENFTEPYSISVEGKADHVELVLNLKKAALANSIMTREALLSTLMIAGDSISRSANVLIAEMVGMHTATPEQVQQSQEKEEKITKLNHALAQAAQNLGFEIPADPSANPLKMAELFANTRSGSLVSRNHLLEIQRQQAEIIFSILANPKYAPQDSDPGLKGYAKLRGLPEDQIRSMNDLAKVYLESIDVRLKTKRAQALKEEREREKAFRQPEVAAARDAIRKSVKLDELVKANDRQGTAKLLEAMLPWQLMESAEKIAWRNWLEAIRHPSSQTIKLYRGLDEYDRPIGPTDRPGFFSVMLTRNQGSYTDRLRSLARARMNLGKSREANKTVVQAPTIAAMFENHSGDPVMSPFLSFSTDLKSLIVFASHGLIEIEIDPRRALPNVTSIYASEMEFLVPLIIFPDEVRRYIHGPGAREKATMYIVANAKPEEALTSNLKAVPFAYRFLSEITQGSAKAISCKNIF